MLRARWTCVRERNLNFRRKTSCRSRSIISSLASLMYRRASTCSESERAEPSSGKRRFELSRHQKQHACRTTCILPLPLSRTLPPFRTQTQCCTLTRPSDPPRRALTRLPRTRVPAHAISNRMRTHPAVNKRVRFPIPGIIRDLCPRNRIFARLITVHPATLTSTRKQVRQ